MVQNSTLVVHSGTYQYLIAGNGINTMTTAEVEIFGSTRIYSFLQCGGIAKDVSTVSLQIMVEKSKTSTWMGIVQMCQMSILQ